MSLFRGFDAESLPSVWDCDQQAQLRLLPADWQLLGEDTISDVSDDGEPILIGVRLYQRHKEPHDYVEVRRRVLASEPWDGFTSCRYLPVDIAKHWLNLHGPGPVHLKDDDSGTASH